jgi:Zn-dependent metalloprotease
VLWDASGTNAVRVWTQNHTALNRQISDKNNNPTNNATIVRTEGQPATGFTDVDNAYTFLGDTYNFYLSRHGRDSFNNAGATLSAIVRYCDTNNSCPWANATAGSPMWFGEGFTTDDIVAHEFTHNVTAFESALIYTNASGAINESLSDIWGEFVDVTNTGGNDDPTNRWAHGEDRSTGPSRNLKSPPLFSHPDRLGSPLYQQPSDTSDQGGVHSNSGVNNKLCYLLTDGDTFNGQTIGGLGMEQVVRLYYEAQVNLLTVGSGWAQLYDALQQAAVNLSWSTTARNNLYRACLAVEIATPPDHIYVDKSIFCLVPAGNPACVANFGPYVTVGQGVAGAHPGDVIHIRTGNYNEPMTISKILTLQAENGPVTIGP